jgi:hypothetical protein
MFYFETSASEARNVDETMESMILKLLEKGTTSSEAQTPTVTNTQEKFNFDSQPEPSTKNIPKENSE